MLQKTHTGEVQSFSYLIIEQVMGRLKISTTRKYGLENFGVTTWKGTTTGKRTLRAGIRMSEIAKYKFHCHLFLLKLFSGLITNITILLQELSEIL